MKPSHERHARFWELFAARLGENMLPQAAMQAVAEAMADDPLASVAAEIQRDLVAGSGFADAVARHDDVFTPIERTLVTVGDQVGCLAPLTNVLAVGLRERILRTAGDEEPAGDPVERFWRAVALLLDAGLPLVRSLNLLAEEIGDAALVAAINRISAAICEGATFSDALAQDLELFPERVANAVRYGESAGQVDVICRRIADAMAANDLASLPTMAAEPGSEAEEPQAPVVKLVNIVLSKCIEDKASDVHFEPTEDVLKIRYRIDGILYEMEPVPAKVAKAVISRLKVMAGLNIAERRLPQDGRMELRINGQRVDLRVSTVPTIHGERVAVRIITRDLVCLSLEQLELGEAASTQVRELCHRPAGLVLVTGPTGSGRTSTVYAMLQELNTVERAIFTIEDPVEVTFRGISQIPVRPHIGLTFPRVLLSVLRQAPNVIYVGELRDQETANMAIQAALTGHLVITTMHTNTAVETVQRLVDMGVPPFLINSSVAGIVSQRLVRKLCPECRRSEPVPPAHSLPPSINRWLESAKPGTIAGPGACEACHSTGYRGRLPVSEVLVPDDAFKQAVATGASGDDLHQAALSSGMRPILQCGLELVAAGRTSLTEIVRVMSDLQEY